MGNSDVFIETAERRSNGMTV